MPEKEDEKEKPLGADGVLGAFWGVDAIGTGEHIERCGKPNGLS